MIRILHLVPHLRYSGIHTQLYQFAAEPGRETCQLHVIALKGHGAAGHRLRNRGIEVTSLSTAPRWDLGGLVRLRSLVRQAKPDLIHAWGLAPLRLLYLTAGMPKCPVLLSQLLPLPRYRNRMSFLDRWLINRCQGLVVPSSAQAFQCRAAGISPAKIEVIAPAVSPWDHQTTERFSTAFQEPAAGSPVVVCVGPLEEYKGFRDAIWAYDVLRHLHRDLKLWIIGAGPDAARLKRFVQILELGHMIRFWGEVENIQPLLSQALAVWIPSRVEAGQHTALEAMAAGRPVVASSLPGLAELIEEGQNGFLVPPGEKVRFAKRTKLLIDHPELGEQLGRAGQRQVAARHTPPQLVEQYQQTYRRLAG